MKKLIPLFVLATMCISGCAGNIQVSNPDTFKSAVIASDDSITAKNAINGLKESVVSTLTADRLNSAQNFQTAPAYSLTMKYMNSLTVTLSVRRILYLLTYAPLK